MHSRNPVLNKAATGGRGFADVDLDAILANGGGDGRTGYEPERAVALPDVIAKTAGLLTVAVGFAAVGWQLAAAAPWLFLVALGATIGLGIVNALKTRINVGLILAYAAASGLLMGMASNLYNTLAVANDYPGVVSQAVLATAVTFAVQLGLYSTGIVKVTSKFIRFMTVAIVSYMALAVVSFIAALFGVGGGWGFYGVGTFGIVIAVIGVLLAAFTLMLDFEAVKQAITHQLPERESWRLAFGLLVTLVWLYLEILRLLTLVASGRD